MFWQVGSSATLGASSVFEGSVLASTSIGLGADATVDGRLLAESATVTLGGNNVVAVSPAPEAAATFAVFAGLSGIVIGLQRARRHFHNSAK